MATFPGGIKSFTNKVDGSDDVMASHINDIQDEVTALETQLLGDLIDYSDISTIVGWSSYTAKQIFYKKVGKSVFIYFLIQGTSNSTGTTFSLPFANAPTMNFTIAPCLIYDNSNFAFGYLAVPIGISTVTLYPNAAGSQWVASGSKYIYGQFSYLTA